MAIQAVRCLPILRVMLTVPPPAGTLIEQQVAARAPSQSYALYLPARYSSQQRWPSV